MDISIYIQSVRSRKPRLLANGSNLLQPILKFYSLHKSNSSKSLTTTSTTPILRQLPVLFLITDVIHCHKGRRVSASFIRSMVKTCFFKSSVHRSIPMPVPLQFQARLPTPTPSIHSLKCAGIMAEGESANLIQIGRAHV